MSGSIGVAVGVASAVGVGILFGPLAGALYGAGMLLAMRGVDTPRPKPGELAKQTAQEGAPRPIIYGRARPIGGCVIHAATPKRRLIEVESGKGGGSPAGTREEIKRTYAIRVCEGPARVVRIWRNGKLVYDARGNDWGARNNPVWLRRCTLYTGAWDQLPDPELEAVWGVGNVSAYRGTCYIVVRNEDVTDTGGAVPQYQFEAERPPARVVTSKPYPAVTVERADVSATVVAVELRDELKELAPDAERADVTATVSAVTLAEEPFLTQPAESADVTATVSAVVLAEEPFLTQPAESADVVATVSAVTMAEEPFLTQPAESADVTATVSAVIFD